MKKLSHCNNIACAEHSIVYHFYYLHYRFLIFSLHSRSNLNLPIIYRINHSRINLVQLFQICCHEMQLSVYLFNCCHLAACL